MPVDTKNISVGKCFETENKQHRRVVKIDDGKVTYESWGGNVGNTKAPLHRNTVNIDKFSIDVENEIPCDSALPPIPTNI